jgi:hypothetical protein
MSLKLIIRMIISVFYSTIDFYSKLFGNLNMCSKNFKVLNKQIQKFFRRNFYRRSCWEPAISLHSYTVPLVQWSTRLLPVMREPSWIPRGILKWNRDSPVSVVSLHWWPQSDWSWWPCLRRASSQTVTRPSCQQSDNPTWSHTALLSWFHTRCRSSFRLHNRHSRLLGGSPLESLQSHCIHTQFHWSSGPPICFLSWGTQAQSPAGYLCETGILLLALSR